MNRIFLDLDGVMADFDRAFPERFGVSHEGMPKKEMWKYISSVPDFFATLPACEGAMDAWRSWLVHLQPVVLTSCGASHYQEIAVQKKRWVRENLGEGVLVIPVSDGLDKSLLVHSSGDILIDDFGKNCDAWQLAGGIAVKHEGDWATTYNAVKVQLNEQR